MYVIVLFVVLEALVSTLRTHLARLTSELASHKSLIEELRADAYADREAQAEVEALRVEVERLAGEVERLKEIVEEGLRERRRVRQYNDSGDGSMGERDQTTVPAQVGIDLTYVTAPMSRGEEREEPLTVEDLEPEPEQQQEKKYESGHERDADQMHCRSQRFIDVRPQLSVTVCYGADCINRLQSLPGLSLTCVNDAQNVRDPVLARAAK